MSLLNISKSINSLDFTDHMLKHRQSFKIIGNFKETIDTFGYTPDRSVIYVTKYGMYDFNSNIQLNVTPHLSFCDVFKHGLTLVSQF